MTPTPVLRARRRALRSYALILLLFLGVLAPRSGEARRLFVPREFKHLQAAIDAASRGDTVWVAAGKYRGPFVLKKPIILFGEGGPDSTILDGGDSVRVLHIEGVTRGAIYGFAIQNGKATAGGGIYCLRDTSFIIGSCKIRSNWDSGVASWKSIPSIVDSEIYENRGSGVESSESRLQLVRVIFRGNRDQSGGAMSLVSTEVIVLRECTFEGNRAEDGTGGAIYAENSAIGVLGCIFRKNTAAAGGGAIAVRDSSHLKLRSSRFAENRSATGGAVLADQSYIDVQVCIFDKNRVTAAGAAVQILGRRTAGVNPLVISNTFYRNGASDSGGAIFAQGVSPEIVRNIFVIDSTAKNRAVLEMKSAPRYVCNLYHTLDGPGAHPSENVIVGNPAFCDPENGDFHVRDLSPAILAPCGRIGALDKGCTSFRVVPSQ